MILFRNNNENRFRGNSSGIHENHKKSENREDKFEEKSIQKFKDQANKGTKLSQLKTPNFQNFRE